MAAHAIRDDEQRPYLAAQPGLGGDEKTEIVFVDRTFTANVSALSDLDPKLSHAAFP